MALPSPLQVTSSDSSSSHSSWAPWRLKSRAGRCGLLLKEHWPEAEVVLATGRGVAMGQIPMGEVIDRAAQLLTARLTHVAVHADDLDVDVRQSELLRERSSQVALEEVSAPNQHPAEQLPALFAVGERLRQLARRHQALSNEQVAESWTFQEERLEEGLVSAH